MDELFPAAGGHGGSIGAAVGQTLDALTQPVAAVAAAQTVVPEEQAKAQAERWKKRIKYFLGQQSTHAKRWKKNRDYANIGGEEGDDEKGLVRVNLVASTVNTIQPNIYAKAPEVSVQPEERVDQADYKDIRPFAKTLELVLNRYAVRGANLKARGKEAVRSSLTCTTGWVKVIYQKNKPTDPLIRNRINDTQDNLQRVEQLLRETEDEAQCAEYKAKMAELRQQLVSMEKQTEVKLAEGLVIDNVQPEHLLILDASVRTIDEFPQASAVAHGIYMTVGAYKAAFEGKEPPKKARRYSATEQSDDNHSEGADARGRHGIDADDELVRVWEIWSKDDLTIYTLCDGADEYCRDPYQPETLGEQWYPFFGLQLWRIAGFLFARTLVDNIIELVDEYNTRRTTAAEHRRKNMPVRLLNKASGITDADVERINSRGATTDIVAIEADPNIPLANQLGQLPEIPYNRDMYDTQDILRDIEMVSGAQDASRGGINQAKTATEAEIMAQGMQGKTSEQIDSIEDWLTAILTYSAQLLLLNLTPEQVKARFGNGAVWPELSKQEAFETIMVQIRAGSTSKPNKMRERDQWLQFLPQLNEAIVKVSELKQNGEQDLADGILKLLEETLRRFDERMSLEELIPGMGEDEEEGGRPNMQKMLEQARQKIAEMTAEAEEQLKQQREEVERGKQELATRSTDLDVRTIKQDAAEQVAAVQAEYADRMHDLDMREAGDKIIGQVRDMLAQHEIKVQQIAASVETKVQGQMAAAQAAEQTEPAASE